ncbi:MAG: hypothetical protein HY753_06105 [Nitrospirae bacterium]|nr:hypothetical protein [Nitrospirota bacterium]
MKGLSTELKVGSFALIIIALLTYMTFKVGGFEWVKKKGYVVYAEFKNIGALDEKTRIKVAGVDAGIIERIEYMELKIGSQPPPLKDGDTIKNVVEVVDIDDLVKNLTEVSTNINNFASALNESIGTPEGKAALKESILNLKDITAGLKDTISVNDKKMRTALDNINNFIASIHDLVEKNKEPLTATIGNVKDFSASLKKDGPDLVANLGKASQELKAMIEENRPSIKSATESIDTISKKIEQGEGSLGKLVKDDRLYESFNKAAEGVNKQLGAIDRFRTFITFQADYLTKPKDAKGQFYVTLQPKPDKYYIFGIGADYFFLKDKAKLSADVWDFGSDEENAKRPHAKIGVDYFIFKHVFLSAGGDNLLNKKRRGAYVGAGVRFEDEDFKYLFGTIPKVPGK